MKKGLKVVTSILLSGFMMGISFSLIGVTMFGSLITLAGFVVFGILLSKNTSKSFLVIVPISTIIEIICVFIFDIYLESQRDPSRPVMSFFGIYLFILLPFSIILRIIIAAILAFVRRKQKKD